ncbi:MAG: tRNA (adenosine(37)-N6)-threonylcarbamoyltransferase complex transferase subunit TsaD [Chloroflexi bacterium]|nr:tRNA (adenosine(37)-N6)-threonylcarbamoyltransferase complex transferase subunit TsaD [Chloroflexota bacterium]
MSVILGIETSCDETGASVVTNGQIIRSNIVASQIDLHARYGGVFPEMASREHILKIVPVVEQALRDAGATWADVDAIAVTYGPGLAGSLLVGVNAAKGLALANGLPLIGVNHLEGHIYAAWLATEPARSEPQFPLVCLIVSGGHTELILMRGHGQYEMLGATLDDAAGEAFDKVSRLLGLGYPGGPAIQKAAEQGDARRVKLPRAWLEGTFDFSFSGLKTAVLHLVKQASTPNSAPKLQPSSLRAEIAEQPAAISDIAAAFQSAVVDVLVEKTRLAAAQCSAKVVVVGGGVAANKRLREQMRERIPVPVLIPPIGLCTDNGAVIAAAGHFHFVRGERSGWDLDVVPGLRLVAA